MIKKLGQYEIIRELGRGAMGRVYAARDPEKRVCALKVLNRGKISSDKLLARFQREAHLLQSLDHPNIIKLFEVGENEGVSFFSMELAKGKELADIIPKEGMDCEQALYIIQRVALACDHAHSRGIIHRDLKPQNVIVDGFGNPHVMDFGIAKSLDEDDNNALTKTGALLGTPAFMSPEQAEGKTHEIDHLADVYALGSTLYTMLAGHPPFDGPNSSQILMKVIKEEPVPLTKLRPDIPAEVANICHRAMAKMKRERYKTAKDFATDIERWFRGRDVIATERSPLERFLGTIVTHKKIAFLCFFSAVILVLGSLFLNKDVDATNKRIQETLQSYENELDGFIEKENYDLAEEKWAIWDKLEYAWNGPVPNGHPLETKSQKVAQGKQAHYKNLLQQKKGPLNSNQTSEKFAEIYVGNKDFLTREGKIYFCYGKWWTEEEARNRGYLIVRIDNSVYHDPNKFFFKGKIENEEEVQKHGFAFKHNDQWLTPTEAENEGFFYVATQAKWLTGKEAVNEGCLFFEEETKRYLTRKQANKMGIFFDNEFSHQWYQGAEAQKRGLTFRHAGQWLTREEAEQKGFTFVRTDRQFGEWKDRDELWLGGIDKTLVHDQAKQQFFHIEYVVTRKWLVGYDKIGQLKIWNVNKAIPEEIRTIFNVPTEVQTVTYDIKSSQIITISPSGIYGYQEQGEVMKATNLKYNNVESSAIDIENDLVIAMMHPQEAVVLKLRNRKTNARYVCKFPETYNKSEFAHIALSDDGRSLVAVTKDKEFFIFYFDGNMGSSAEVTGTLILLDEFKMTQQNRTISAIATINREYMAISFEEEPYEVEVWNIDKRSKRKILKAHQAPVTSISFGNNAESIATSGEDGKIFLWTIQK